MSGIKGINKHSSIASDEFVPNPSLPVVEIIKEYIIKVAQKNNAEILIIKRAKLFYGKFLHEDFYIAKQRMEGELASQKFALEDEGRANKSKKATERRLTKYIGKIVHKWNKHDWFMYKTKSSFTILGLLVALAFITTTIYSSGVVELFSEYVSLAMLVATAPLFAVITAKSALSLFTSEKGKLIYKRTIFSSAFIAFIAWVITYTLVFDQKSVLDLLTNIENTTEEDNSYYQIWLIAQLFTETLCAAAIGLSAQGSYHKNLEKKSVKNSVWDKAEKDETTARTKVREFDNRVARFQHCLDMWKSGEDDYIEECLGYYYGVQDDLNLASQNKLAQFREELNVPQSQIKLVR